MSYNCDSTIVLNSNATMRRRDVLALLRDSGDNLPEGCFLNNVLPKSDPVKPLDRMTPDELRKHADTIAETDKGTVEIKNLDWYGEGSGHTFDYFKETVAPLIMGRIEAVFVWEGGDSISGLIIEGGKITECDVSYKLTPKKKP